jgi:hypothetical protein
MAENFGSNFLMKTHIKSMSSLFYITAASFIFASNWYLTKYQIESALLTAQITRANQEKVMRFEKLNNRATTNYLSERVAQLHEEVLAIQFRYEDFLDTVRALDARVEKISRDQHSRVELVSKEVSGLGGLLKEVPNLLQRVEVENRNNVETVSKKVFRLEKLLEHPALLK